MGDLAGSPAVVNGGALAVTNNWTILAADFPKADSAVENAMTVEGALAFADGATFSIDDYSAIHRDDGDYVVARATGGISGLPAPADPDCPLELVGNGGELILRRAMKPFVLILR